MAIDHLEMIKGTICLLSPSQVRPFLTPMHPENITLILKMYQVPSVFTVDLIEDSGFTAVVIFGRQRGVHAPNRFNLGRSPRTLAQKDGCGRCAACSFTGFQRPSKNDSFTSSPSSSDSQLDVLGNARISPLAGDSDDSQLSDMGISWKFLRGGNAPTLAPRSEHDRKCLPQPPPPGFRSIRAPPAPDTGVDYHKPLRDVRPCIQWRSRNEAGARPWLEHPYLRGNQ